MGRFCEPGLHCCALKGVSSIAQALLALENTLLEPAPGLCEVQASLHIGENPSRHRCAPFGFGQRRSMGILVLQPGTESRTQQ